MKNNGVTNTNWPSVPLGQLLAQAQSGFACGERDKDGVAQLRMNNVDTKGRFVWSEVVRVPADKATIKEYRLMPSDVMFNNTNSTKLVGKSALFQDYVEPVVYSNHFTRLRVRPTQLDPSYLAAWLNHEWQRGTFAKICNRWIGQSAVKVEKLLSLEIPLPPLAEQERIAARLTEQLAAVESARAAAQARLAAAKTLPAAYLREVFEGPEASEWEIHPLGKLVSKVGSGITPSGGQASYVRHGVPLIRSQNVHNMRFESKGLAFISASQDKAMIKSRVEANDVLLNITGASIGRACVAPADRCPANVNQHVAIIRPKPGLLDQPFLCAFLCQPAFQRFIWESQAGATRQALTKDMIERFEVPIPSIADQRRLAAALAQRLAEAERLTAILRDELAAIDAIPAALLGDAFNGQA